MVLAAGGSALGSTDAGAIRLPGGLVRRHAAALRHGIATVDDDHLADAVGAGPVHPAARGRHAATRGPVLLRSMAGPASMIIAPGEIAPSTARLLAAAPVQPRGLGRAPAEPSTTIPVVRRTVGPESSPRPSGRSGTATAAAVGARPLTQSPAGHAGAASAAGSTAAGTIVSAAAHGSTGTLSHAAASGSGVPAASAAPRGGTAASAPAGLAAQAAGARPAIGSLRRFPAIGGQRAPDAPPDWGPPGPGRIPAVPGQSRFVSMAGIPAMLRRMPSERAPGAERAAGPGRTSADRGPAGHRAVRVGAVASLLAGAPGRADGTAPPVAVGSASGAGGGPQTSAPWMPIRRSAPGRAIVPSTGALLGSVTPRLAVLPLPARVSGDAVSGTVAAGGAPVGAARGSGAGPLAGVAPATALGAPPAPVRRAGGAAEPALPASSSRAWHGTSPGAVTPRVVTTRSAATGASAAPVRRHRDAGAADVVPARAGDIRPATVEMLRTARVAPPRGVRTQPAVGLPGVAARAAPAAPASAVGGASEVVIRRAAPAAPGPRPGPSGPSAPVAGAPTSAARPQIVPDVAPDSLIRRVPAGLFERARAELRTGIEAQVLPGGGALRRNVVEATGTAVSEPSGDQHGSESVQGALSSREWDQLVDEVVRRIEARVAGELARRGRRFTPWAL